MSPSQLRTYGAGGFRLLQQEESRGCPRQYKAKYVEERLVEPFSYPLAYGSMVHEVLYLMEEEAIGPEEALDRCFPPELPPEAYREALDDLTDYLERGASPMDRFGTIAVEQELDALLYVDEDFGPIHFRGIIDWIGIDLNVPNLLHVVDYKTNRHPPSVDDVRGDVQLKAYHWLVRQNLKKYIPSGRAKIVVHLDAIKWREVEVAFDDRDIEDWHSWAVAVVRKILRDDEGLPELNPGCAWCPVKDDCPAYDSLPTLGEEVAGQAPAIGSGDAARLAWRDQANAVRLLLEKAVKVVDEDFKERARLGGVLAIGDVEYAAETEWEEEYDMPSLHAALDDVFYRVVTVGKGRLEKETKDWEPSRVSPVRAAIKKSPKGTKIVRRKRSE